MIHPSTKLEYINDDIGYGVVATEFIPMGTITWAADKFDKELAPDEVISMEEIYKNILLKYAFRNNKGNYVLCWDISRYVNHSFNSNCLSTPYNYEIAIRDIRPGEELTDDYGYLNIEKPFRGVNEGTKRKVVYPNDLLKYHRVWDKKLIKAMKHFLGVEQPLRELLSFDTWQKSANISKGEEPMDSILECYFDASITHCAACCF